MKSAVAAKVKGARFPEINTVDGFDFDFCPVRKKLKARYLALHDVTFLDKGINPLFIGSPAPARPTSRARSRSAPARRTDASSSSAPRGCSTSFTAPSCTAPSSASCAAT